MWGRIRTLAAGSALALALFAAGGPAHAQAPLSSEASLEPRRATLGDPLTLTIVARHPPGTQVVAPDGPDDFAPLELVELRPAETRDMADGRRQTRFVYILAAFRTGEVRPPPLRLALEGGAGGETAVQPPPVTIEGVLPAGDLRLRGPAGPLAASAGTPAWVWAALVMAGFVGLSVVTMWLARVPVRRAPPPLAAPQEHPETTAQRELEAVAGAGLLERGELPEYYARISGCLRRYLERRFGVPATALTPQELEARLEALGVGRWPVRLAANLLQQSEAVQFARYQPARERAGADLAAAQEVIALLSGREDAARGDEEAAVSP